jgi:hypothetical protein
VKALTLALFLFILPAQVFAAPSFGAATGLIDIPSADVLRLGQIGAGYYHESSGGVSIASLGIMKNFEIGIGDYRYNYERQTLLSGKFSLASETIMTPGAAIGFSAMGTDSKTSVYAVISKSLPFGFRIHAGIGTQQFSGVFAAIEKNISPSGMITGKNVFPATTLIAEYSGQTMNYGARISIVPGLKAELGRRNHGTYVGLDFTS